MCHLVTASRLHRWPFRHFNSLVSTGSMTFSFLPRFSFPEDYLLVNTHRLLLIASMTTSRTAEIKRKPHMVP